MKMLVNDIKTSIAGDIISMAHKMRHSVWLKVSSKKDISSA